MTEVFSQKDNASNFYVPSPLQSSTSQSFDSERYDTSEPTSLPPYPFHDTLETLAETSVPNSPNCCKSPLAEGCPSFAYCDNNSGSYDRQLNDQDKKDVYENVVFNNSSSGSSSTRSKVSLYRSNSESRENVRSQDHSYENVRYHRGQRSDVGSPGSPYCERQTLARSNSETRGNDHHCYENVSYQKNGKMRNQLDSSFEQIHIPRVTPRKRITDFKVGGQVNNYSNDTTSVATTIVGPKDDGPSSLGTERSPNKKSTRRLNSRSVANIPSSSGANLKAWQVSASVHLYVI